MQDLTIRPATLADIDALSALFVELDEHHFRRRPDEYLKFDGPVRDQMEMQRLIQEPGGAILVAVNGANQVVGFTHIYERTVAGTVVTAPRQVCEMDSIVVAAQQRRRGVAQALLRAAIEWGRQRGLATLELYVRGYNSEAVGFYEEAGFETLVRRWFAPSNPPHVRLTRMGEAPDVQPVQPPAERPSTFTHAALRR